MFRIPLNLKRPLISPFVVLLTLCVCTDVMACPTCKAAVANGHDGVGLGYYWSILFMISMPFLLFGGWALFIYRAFRQNQKQFGDQLSEFEFPSLEIQS